MRACLALRRRENSTELKEVIVVVPSKWRLIKKIEQLKEETKEEDER